MALETPCFAKFHLLTLSYQCQIDEASLASVWIAALMMTDIVTKLTAVRLVLYTIIVLLHSSNRVIVDS